MTDFRNSLSIPNLLNLEKRLWMSLRPWFTLLDPLLGIVIKKDDLLCANSVMCPTSEVMSSSPPIFSSLSLDLGD